MEGTESKLGIGGESCDHLRCIPEIRRFILPGKKQLKTMGVVLCAEYKNLYYEYLAYPSLVLGAASKALATIATQPLIVAKVGLQSRPPPPREGRHFKSFTEVMSYIIEHEGPFALFKGIAPQISKGILVQGLLMMTKERYVGFGVIVGDDANDKIEWRFCSSSFSHTCVE